MRKMEIFIKNSIFSNLTHLDPIILAVSPIQVFIDPVVSDGGCVFSVEANQGVIQDGSWIQVYFIDAASSELIILN